MDWTKKELQASVTAYVQMLHAEQHGKSYSKAAMNRQLREGPLVQRGKGSVEFRMQNISAVLESVGLQRIKGYKPRGNVGSEVKKKILAILGELNHLNPDDYELTSDSDTLKIRADKLRKRGFSGKPSGQKKPKRSRSTRIEILRDPAVRAWVLNNAAGICELAGEPAPFLNSEGEPYLEVHHVITLAEGGPDTTENAVALCPNCHQRCHHSQDASVTREELYSRVSRLKHL